MARLDADRGQPFLRQGVKEPGRQRAALEDDLLGLSRVLANGLGNAFGAEGLSLARSAARPGGSRSLCPSGKHQVQHTGQWSFSIRWRGQAVRRPGVPSTSGGGGVPRYGLRETRRAITPCSAAQPQGPGSPCLAGAAPWRSAAWSAGPWRVTPPVATFRHCGRSSSRSRQYPADCRAASGAQYSHGRFRG